MPTSVEILRVARTGFLGWCERRSLGGAVWWQRF